MIIELFWLLLPAGIANMSPVLFKSINFLKFPVDFNKKFRKKPIFGKNKTYRGFFFGILMAIITVHIETLLGVDNFVGFSNPLLLGLLLGFGALFGDLIKSFFKRQLNIKPGKPFIPFDQLDWVLGSLIFVSFYYTLTAQIWIVSLILFGLIKILLIIKKSLKNLK